MNCVDKGIVIKGIELKNLLVMAPVTIAKAKDGNITPEILSYYDERTKGGYIGLVIIEHSYICKQGMARIEQISISKDDDIEGLKKLADVVHKNGSKVLIQLNHAGSATWQKVTGQQVIGPSAILNPALNQSEADMPKEMTITEIEKVRDDFVSAARRAKVAGFDGVEIHAAHGYLLNQFYSPLTNNRNDKYSVNSLQGRLQLHKEIYEAVRKEVGDDYIIAIRLGGADYVDGGSTISDSVDAAKILETWGVDIIDVSGGMCRYTRQDNTEPGYFSDMTEEIKKVVKTPIILTGGITKASEAETLLSTNKADLIGIGRAIFKNPLWAKENMEK